MDGDLRQKTKTSSFRRPDKRWFLSSGFGILCSRGGSSPTRCSTEQELRPLSDLMRGRDGRAKITGFVLVCHSTHTLAFHCAKQRGGKNSNKKQTNRQNPPTQNKHPNTHTHNSRRRRGSGRCAPVWPRGGERGQAKAPAAFPVLFLIILYYIISYYRTYYIIDTNLI